MIKYLLLMALVLLVVWLVRQARVRATRRDRQETAEPLQSPTQIVQCAHCHVHLPRAEALPGSDGRLYCGAAHRQEAEGA